METKRLATAAIPSARNTDGTQTLRAEGIDDLPLSERGHGRAGTNGAGAGGGVRGRREISVEAAQSARWEAGRTRRRRTRRQRRRRAKEKGAVEGEASSASGPGLAHLTSICKAYGPH